MRYNYLNLAHAVIVMTESCNLRCRYCYVKKNRRCMDEKTMVAAVDFINLNSKARNPFLMLIGGELMLFPEKLDFLMSYALKRNPRTKFSIITNGTILNEKVKHLLKKYKKHIKVFGISIDGYKGLHNKNRIYPDGRGSWDDMVSNLPFFLNIFPDIKVESRFNAKTVKKKTLIKMISCLYDLGVRRISFYPILGSITHANCERIKNSYLHLAAWCSKKSRSKDKIFFRQALINPDLLLPERKAIPCLAAKGIICIGASGELYPCHELWIKKKNFLGTVFQPEYKRIGMFNKTFYLKLDQKKKYFICPASKKTDDANFYTNSIKETDPNLRLFVGITKGLEKEELCGQKP